MNATRSHVVAAVVGPLLAVGLTTGPLLGRAGATASDCAIPLCITAPPATPPPPAAPTPPPPTTTTTEPQQEGPAPRSAPDADASLLALMNRDRAAQQLAPLTARADVDAVATGWSGHLADAGALSHNDAYFTAESRQRLGGQALGENVARNGSPEGAHDAFMASPHHRANVLDPRFTIVGLGAEYRDGSWWITEDFLQPRAAAPGAPTGRAPAPSSRAGTGMSGVVARPVELAPSVPGGATAAGDAPHPGAHPVSLQVSADAAAPAHAAHLVPSGVAAADSRLGSLLLAVALAAAGWCCRVLARRRLH